MRLAHQLAQLLDAELLQLARFAQADVHIYTIARQHAEYLRQGDERSLFIVELYPKLARLPASCRPI